MLMVERLPLKIFLFCIILFISFLQTASLSVCPQDQQYYDAEKKNCMPCKNCTSPLIVQATCNPYSNTICGYPYFNGGSSLQIFPESSYENSLKENNQTIDSKLIAQKDINSKKAKLKKRRKKFRRKLHSHSKNIESKVSKARLSKEEHIQSEENSAINNISENIQNVSNENYDVTEENFSPTNASISTLEENGPYEIKLSYLYSYFGKVIVSAIVISVNLLLILILIFKIIKTCHNKKSKGGNCLYSCNQKFPNPSQKPIKCRFTAVLPSKSPEYSNVESYSNSLLSPTCSSNSNSANWNNSCAAGNASTLLEETRERTENSSLLPFSREREIPVEPLLTSQEVVESVNAVQLYSRIPSPNPFTMDRLLEQRRAIGSSSVENNLYVETWCSSPSPMLSRSQGSSIAPSPALSNIRKPFSTSNSSSPLTTRTFRATPAFTSFHPNRL